MRASGRGSKLCALDLGSKTFKAVLGEIVEDHLITRLVGKRDLALGKEVAASGGIISEAKLVEVGQALAELRNACAQAGATEFRAIATRAIRAAKNSGDVVRIASAIGIDLEVANGVREGQVSYLAATGGAPKRLVSDLGSHSLQLAWRTGKHIEAISADIGYEVVYPQCVREATTFPQAEQALHNIFDRNLPNIPTDVKKIVSLSANSAVMFATGKPKQEITNRTIQRDVLLVKLEELRGLSARKFEALRCRTEKASKVFPGLVLLDYLMQRLQHNETFIAEIELPVGLVVEHFHAAAETGYYRLRLEDNV